MCRHLAYLGPPRPAADVVTGGGHSLHRQAWAPSDMRGGGTVNADGWGAAWWDADGRARRYRSAAPVWADPSGLEALGSAVSGAVVAAVRSATEGMPCVATAAAPFTDGRWAFSHNGALRGWPGAAAALASTLPVTDLLTLDAPTDSALLWAAARRRLTDPGGPDSPADPGAVLAGLVLEVAAAAPGSRLNLLLCDGTAVHATTWGHSLWVRCRPGEVLVASEPTDPGPAWTPVPDRHLLTATAGTLALTPLTPTTLPLDPPSQEAP